MSNLDDLYREIILEHYRSPRNRGELPVPPAVRVDGFNPLCGDEVSIYLDVHDHTLVNIKMTGHGCSISQASSSLMSTAIKGKSLESVRATINTFRQLMTVHEATLEHDVNNELGTSTANRLKSICARSANWPRYKASSSFPCELSARCCRGTR
jgi:SUF system NifU family Fe-S assembly protein